MKVILDMDPGLMGEGLNVLFEIMRQFPDQKTGTSNGIAVANTQGKFVVIRNQDSYTVMEEAE